MYKIYGYGHIDSPKKNSLVQKLWIILIPLKKNHISTKNFHSILLQRETCLSNKNLHSVTRS